MTEADDPGPVMKTKNKKTPRDTKKGKDKGKLTVKKAKEEMSF